MSSTYGDKSKEAAADWYSNLVSWIRNQGGEIHSSLDLDVVDKSSRGIKATADIDEGSVLIRLPAKLALDGSGLPTAYEVKDASGRDDTGKRTASPWLRCLTSLLTESAGARGQATKKNAGDDAINFAPYLNSLPESYDTLMDERSWSNEDVATLLAGTALGTVVTEERKVDMMNQRYKLSIVPYLQHVGLVAANDSSNSDNDYEDFKKACACVSTRGFHLQQGDQQKSKAADTNDYSGPYLLPYIDLLNHCTEKKCTTLQRDTTDGAFVMIAERKISAGEEIFHTYGTGLTAAQILQTFGFVEIGAARRAANSQWNDDQYYGISPATLSAEAILNACRSIIDSSFPSDLKRSMEQNDFEDETWDVSVGKDRDVLLSHGLISSDILVAEDNHAVLSDELVTLCCLPFLPDEVFSEWSEEPCLWGSEVLEDYFLGKLALRALMKAIGTKLEEYAAIDASGCGLSKDDIEKGQCGEDRALLQKLLDEPTDPVGSAMRSKAMSALTIRLEEKHCLDLLKKEVIDTLKSLDDDGDDEEGDFDKDDDANKGGDKRNAFDDGAADDLSSKKIKL